MPGKHTNTRQVQKLPIPTKVRYWAKLGLLMKKEWRFDGGVDTGIRRARQLANDKFIPLEDFKTMRNWFARHGPGAKPVVSGRGISYQKNNKHGNCVQRFHDWYFCRSKNEQVILRQKHKNRGFVAWCLWGGDAAFEWIKKEAKKYLGEKYDFNKPGNTLSQSKKDRKVRRWIETQRGRITGGAGEGLLVDSLKKLLTLDLSQLQRKLTSDEKKYILYTIIRCLKGRELDSLDETKKKELHDLFQICFWGEKSFKQLKEIEEFLNAIVTSGLFSDDDAW